MNAVPTSRSEYLKEVVAALWGGLVMLPRTLLLIAWLWLRQRAAHRRATAQLHAALAHPPVEPSALRALEPGLYEVAPWFLERGEPAADALTLVHLLGTGENLYSPLVGLAELCRAQPALRALRHVIVDTPHDAACFLGPNEFAIRLRRVLAPELERNRERVVIAGLSRGAVAALDLGAELAVHGTRVGVLALSAPLARPTHPPHTVINIGGFEPITENFVQQIVLLPWLAPIGNWLLRSLYIRFCGFVLAELNMVNDAQIAMYARFIAECDPQQACLRAVREFALLGRVSDAELRHAVSGATRRFAEIEDARVIWCWGERDAWVEIATCQERLKSALDRQHVPAERMRVYVLPDFNHSVGREPNRDYAQLSALLTELCEHARAVATPREMEKTA